MTQKQTTVAKPTTPAVTAAPQGKKVAAKAPPKTEVKAAAPAKAEAKPAPTVLSSRLAAKGKPVYVVAETARPQFGRALYAHTHAALSVLGLFQPSRPSVPKRSVLTLIGQRAVKHHMGDGNFEDTADHGIRLSSAGLSHFRQRAEAGKFDAKVANAFIDLILDGKTDGTGIAKANVYQTQF